jgi:hypothetical protein
VAIKRGRGGQAPKIVVNFSIGDVEREKQQISLGKVCEWESVKKICLKSVDREDIIPTKSGDNVGTKF